MPAVRGVWTERQTGTQSARCNFTATHLHTLLMTNILCVFLRLWSGSTTPGSFTCPHTHPQARVSITRRSCWRNMRNSTSQPRLGSRTCAQKPCVDLCMHVRQDHIGSVSLLLSKLRSALSCWSSWPMVSARKATVMQGRSKNGWQLWTSAIETFRCAWTSTAAVLRKLWASPPTPTRRWVLRFFARQLLALYPET